MKKDILHPNAERRLIHMQITLDIDDITAALLATLDDEGSVQNAINELVSHAMSGVYRPGSWERPRLTQAFGKISSPNWNPAIRSTAAT